MFKQIFTSSKSIYFKNIMCKDHEKLSKELNIKHNIIESYNNWYYINDKWYYFKEINDDYFLINELLGQYLAKYFKLDTIVYYLGIMDNKVGLLSQNIRIQNIKYIDNLNREKYDILKYISENKNSTLLEQLLRMSVLDFYSNQIDRVYQNILIYFDNNKYYLGPLYDYSNTFNAKDDYGIVRKYFIIDNLYNKNKYSYINDLFEITFEKEKMQYLYKNYQELYESVKKILKINMENILKNIEKDYDLKIENDIKDEYLKYDEEKKNSLEN